MLVFGMYVSDSSIRNRKTVLVPFPPSTILVNTGLFPVAKRLLIPELSQIAFLVFLNSSVSFVITNLIGQRTKVGDAVGTLGFADELVALVACPAWGVMSDRLGVRMVSYFSRLTCKRQRSTEVYKIPRTCWVSV